MARTRVRAGDADELRPWKDWKQPTNLGETLDRIVELLGTVPPHVRQKISDAMRDADFEVTFTHGSTAGVAIVVTIPNKGEDMPLALLPVLALLGYPRVPPSSITPLARDRSRAFWEFGQTAIRGEMVPVSG